MADYKPIKLVNNKLAQFASTDTVPTQNLGTGVADGTTYLRGDQTWATVGPSMIYPGVGIAVSTGVAWATSIALGGANDVLHGNSSFSPVVEADISLSNNSTNDVTTSKHGFCPILPNNATLFLNGQGNYAAPAGLTISNSYSLTAFSGTSTTIIHNWGTYPIVQCLTGGAVFQPLSIVHNTLNDFTVTFAVSTSGYIIASVGGPQPQALTVTAADYVVLVTDRIIKVTAMGKYITLPTSVGNTGREFYINNASTGNIYVNTTSSQLISNQLVQTLPPYSTMNVYADGAGYWII